MYEFTYNSNQFVREKVSRNFDFERDKNYPFDQVSSWGNYGNLANQFGESFGKTNGKLTVS